ncbi:hypothetical protein B0H16DRAFT_770100 [Mycena metata]|uniref:N-acetyltransferase domain-containing protein n=1 Tax=Mycena metata TaxID=1033252 RepID=A0AAD7IZ83_9AGAR|nr:hypothetical protein B0H16DRAFT_770100 [Mycena metata]
MSEIYVRQFRPSDFPQVRDLLYEGLLTGKGSVRSVVERRFRFRAPSIVAYLLIGVGLILSWKSLPTEWMSGTAVTVISGALVTLGGMMLILLRATIISWMRSICKEALATDMRDIPTHYNAPAVFLVAAVRPTEKPHSDADLTVGEEQPEQVLACIALEYLPETDARTAEIRHMIVGEKHRRRGLASRLILEVIRHAEVMPGVEAIKLKVTEFQPDAGLLFESFGWEWVKVDFLQFVRFRSIVEDHHYRRPVRVGEYSELRARAEQGAALRRMLS